MYINPETNIKLLKNVPLDNTYEHTIHFDSSSAQASYFSGLTKYNLVNYTYQRVNKGVSRVGIKADNLYDCNYMMFQNSAFGSKWFYAFITSVEYINNECSEINFEIDVMQTWFFDNSPDYCFVEREHSYTDAIGGNIIPENINCGEYVYNGYGVISSALSPLCVVIAVCDTDVEPDGTLYDGIYGGCALFAYNTSDVTSIANKLAEYSDSPESIVSMYMCPVIATGSAIPTGGTQITYSSSAYTIDINATPVSSASTLDGYKPKNKKLYTYPFNFLSIATGKTSATYRYEFFSSLTPKFKIKVPLTMPLQIALRPYDYKGSNSATLNCETLTLDDYPMCSWNSDAYKAWLAQNAIPIATTGAEVAGSLLMGALGMVAPPVAIGATVASLAGASSLMNQGYQASIAADVSRGNTNSGNIDVASGTKNFYGGRCSVSNQYARMIDDYFTRFGYATKRIKIPNRNSRPHWNYVKTIGATVTGSVPADDMRKICSIYDNGITFWKNGSEVGNYSLDNTV